MSTTDSRLVPPAGLHAVFSAALEELVARLVDDRVEQRLAELRAGTQAVAEASEFMSVEQAALYLGCGYRACPKCDGVGQHEGEPCSRCDATGQVVNRARVDYLLSAGFLSRHKDIGRTLIRRSEVEAHVRNPDERRRRR